MSGFQSPNHTQTPNDLFDVLLPQMGMSELKVIMCIIRHTFGYHKEEAKLSIRAIARFTGLSANSVMEGAMQAEDHGLIERYTDGNKTTLWRAIVSVAATETPASRLPRRRVAATATQLRVKENIKKDINKEEEAQTENVFATFEHEIGVLTPHIADELEEAEQVHTAQWVCMALRLASVNGKRNWAYAKAVLTRWKAEGYGSMKNNERKSREKPDGFAEYRKQLQEEKANEQA